MRFLFSCLLLIPIHVKLFAQLTVPGSPLRLKLATLADSVYEMPALNNAHLLKQCDEVIDNKKPMVFAHSFDVNFTPENSGMWFEYNNLNIWRMHIRSKGARSINIIFTEYEVVPGVRIFLYSPTSEEFLGAFSDKNNKPYQQLAISPVADDMVMIEMHVEGSRTNYGKLRIGKVSHDFRGILDLKDGQFNKSGYCNIDAVCDESEYVSKIKNSVCRIIFNGNQLCTGALINNTRYDGTPYLLTANHCLGSSANAQSAIFLFGYETPHCDTLTDWSSELTLSGSQLKSTSSNLDFALVKLDEPPTAVMDPYYAGWNIAVNGITSAFSIHHPQGDVRKICYETDAPSFGSYPNDYDTDSHWYIQSWEGGVTEPGSSGGPLFDQNGRIIGDLTGGDANCSFLFNDYFARISESWDKYPNSINQLKHWLDPENTGAQSIEGYDPFQNFKSTCTDAGTGFGSTYVLEYGNEGYWGGHNEDGYSQFAEGFMVTGASDLLGARIRVANANFFGTSSRITLRAWSGVERPEIVIAEEDYKIKFFADNHDYNLYFKSVASLHDRFFIGVKIYYTYPTDTFALAQAERSNSQGYFMYDGASWHKSTDLANDTFSLAIQPLICGALLDTNEHVFSSGLNIRQDFNSNLIIVQKPFFVKSNYRLKITDIAGRQVWYEMFLPDEEEVYIDDKQFGKGVYIFSIDAPSGLYAKKVLIF